MTIIQAVKSMLTHLRHQHFTRPLTNLNPDLVNRITIQLKCKDMPNSMLVLS
jgi:hypothetical protein